MFIKPADGVYTSYYGMRNGDMHDGVDIAKSGTVPVVASAAGTVSKSYYSDSYGNVVFIKHSINGKAYETVYAHLQNRAVSAGQVVNQGQFLGYMGNTGRSTGQHLHFEIHQPSWRNSVDPMDYIGATTPDTPSIDQPNYVTPKEGAYGRLTVTWNETSQVNVYDAPNGNFKSRVDSGASYNVYNKKDGWYDIGASTWVRADYVTFYRYQAEIYNPNGSYINYFNKPDGSYLGRVGNGEVYPVFTNKNGWVEIEEGNWVPSTYVKFFLSENGETTKPEDIPFIPKEGSIGSLVVTWSDTSQVNVYNSPNGTFKNRVDSGSSHIVYAEKDGWYDIGGGTWIKGDYVSFDRYQAEVINPNGSLVNIFDGPNGAYLGKVEVGRIFNVYKNNDGWVAIGAGNWIPAQYVDFHK